MSSCVRSVQDANADQGDGVDEDTSQQVLGLLNMRPEGDGRKCKGSLVLLARRLKSRVSPGLWTCLVCFVTGDNVIYNPFYGYSGPCTFSSLILTKPEINTTRGLTRRSEGREA